MLFALIPFADCFDRSAIRITGSAILQGSEQRYDLKRSWLNRALLQQSVGINYFGTNDGGKYGATDLNFSPKHYSFL